MMRALLVLGLRNTAADAGANFGTIYPSDVFQFWPSDIKDPWRVMLHCDAYDPGKSWQLDSFKPTTVLGALRHLDAMLGAEFTLANPLHIYTVHARSVLMRYVELGKLRGIKWQVLGNQNLVTWYDMVEQFSAPEILPLAERKAFSDERIRALLSDGERIAECEASQHPFPYVHYLWRRILEAQS